MSIKTARNIKSELKLERGMFDCDVAAYNGVSKQAAAFPDCLPAIILMEMGLRAAVIEDLEAELEWAEECERVDAEHAEHLAAARDHLLLWMEGLPEDPSGYEAVE